MKIKNFSAFAIIKNEGYREKINQNLRILIQINLFN